MRRVRIPRGMRIIAPRIKYKRKMNSGTQTSPTPSSAIPQNKPARCPSCVRQTRRTSYDYPSRWKSHKQRRSPYAAGLRSCTLGKIGSKQNDFQEHRIRLCIEDRYDSHVRCIPDETPCCTERTTFRPSASEFYRCRFCKALQLVALDLHEGCNVFAHHG